MSVVVGTAGHIDHGKTTLLRALTGIDADRLPEERRRGMTIDVGYAHLALADGSVLDFVDVPGHDRLVGNMLVGAGEIDAALVVVAADDGPNAQTIEHLELLDALGIGDGVVAVTKADMVAADRVAEVAAEVEALIGRTTLAGAPVVVVSAVTGAGVEALRARVGGAAGPGGRAGPSRGWPRPGPRLAIDRVFAVKGRGTVVTGSLRGGRVAAGDVLRLLPDGLEVRVREVQVRGATVGASAVGATDAVDGGRTALLVGGVEAGALRRGQVLTTDAALVATSRVLVAMRAPAGLGGLTGAVAPAPAGSRSPAPAPRDGAGGRPGRARPSRGHRPAGRIAAGDPAAGCADRGRGGRPVRAPAAFAGFRGGRRGDPGPGAAARGLAAPAHGRAGGVACRRGG